MNFKELKLVGLFYLALFIGTAFNATEAVWVVYMITKNFTFTQIGLNFGVFALSRFLFEVPTGAIADVYGRKISAIWGWILMGISFILLPFVTTFSTWIIIVFLSAIPYTMISGASDAWAVDWIKKKKAKHLFKHYFAHTETIRNLSFAIAGALGTILLFRYTLDSLFYLVGIGFILAGIVLMFQKEYFIKKNRTIKEAIKKSIANTKDGLKYTIKKRNVRYLALSTLFLSFSALAWVAWEPLFLQNNIEIKFFPLIMAAAFLFSSFTAYLSKYIVQYFKNEKNYLIATTLFMSLAHIAVFFIAGPIAAITFFILKIGFFSSRFPIKQNLLHESILSRLRATIGSVDEMIDAFAIVIATLIGGVLMDHTSVTTTILVTGILMLPSVLFSGLIKTKQRLHLVKG